MINIDKHIAYWKNGSEEDFEVAEQLIRSGKIRHGLFFLHLALEKLLKAHICLKSNDISPRLHNLTRLAELTKIDLQQERIDFLSDMNSFNIEGRYPEMWGAIPSLQGAEVLLQNTKEMMIWLKNRL